MMNSNPEANFDKSQLEKKSEQPSQSVWDRMKNSQEKRLDRDLSLDNNYREKIKKSDKELTWFREGKLSIVKRQVEQCSKGTAHHSFYEQVKNILELQLMGFNDEAKKYSKQLQEYMINYILKTTDENYLNNLIKECIEEAKERQQELSKEEILKMEKDHLMDSLVIATRLQILSERVLALDTANQKKLEETIDFLNQKAQEIGFKGNR